MSSGGGCCRAFRGGRGSGGGRSMSSGGGGSGGMSSGGRAVSSGGRGCRAMSNGGGSGRGSCRVEKDWTISDCYIAATVRIILSRDILVPDKALGISIIYILAWIPHNDIIHSWST